jgi:hypothetical protein
MGKGKNQKNPPNWQNIRQKGKNSAIRETKF